MLILLRGFILSVFRWIGWMIIFLAIFFFLIALLTRFYPVYINTTESLPLGVYKKSSAPIEKGAFVAFCPPDKEIFTLARERGFINGNNGINNGQCDSGNGLLFKQIVAVEGDLVSIDSQGVAVNGKKISGTEQLKIDRNGRTMPAYELKLHRINQQEVLLIANHHPRSFDARYFGLVDRSLIVTRVKPWIIYFKD